MTSTMQAILLGVVQGVTEFLPISSSGHLMVTSYILQGQPLPLAASVALHMGTLAALLMYFHQDWWHIAKHLYAYITHPRPPGATHTPYHLFLSLVLASIPAAIFGCLGKDWIELHCHHPLVVAATLCIFGWLLWWTDARTPHTLPLESLSLKQAFYIGCAQAMALIPGVSRSGITMTAGRALGLTRPSATRFSFLLAAPVTGGAILLELTAIQDLWGVPEFYYGIGAAFVSGCIAIHGFLHIVQKFGFLSFALYRTALALGITYGWLYSRG